MRRFMLNKLRAILLHFNTFNCHFLPILLEAWTLYPNIRYISENRTWYEIDTARSGLPESLIILAPRNVVARYIGTISYPSLWTIGQADVSCNIINYIKSKHGNHPLLLRTNEDKSPSDGMVNMLLSCLVLRWSLLILRAILVVSYRPNTNIRFRGWNSFISFAFIYISSCIFTFALLAMEIRECIEWWALGDTPLTVLYLQKVYWALNAGALILTTVAIGIFNLERIPLDLPTLKSFSHWAHSYCADVLQFIASVYFCLFAFLIVLLVLILGIRKVWIMSIWTTLGLLAVDTFVRVYAAQSNTATSGIIRSLSVVPQVLGKMRTFFGEEAKKTFLKGSDAHVFVVSDKNYDFDKSFTSSSSKNVFFEIDHKFSGVSMLSAASGLGDDKYCLICFEKAAKLIMTPCGHGSCCRECGEKILEREQKRVTYQTLRDPNHSPELYVACPFCRSHATEIYEMLHPPRPINAPGENGFYVNTKLVWKFPFENAPADPLPTGEIHEMPLSDLDLDRSNEGFLLNMDIPVTRNVSDESGPESDSRVESSESDSLPPSSSNEFSSLRSVSTTSRNESPSNEQHYRKVPGIPRSPSRIIALMHDSSLRYQFFNSQNYEVTDEESVSSDSLSTLPNL